MRLFQIHAGLLTYTSAWNPAFGAPFRKAIEARAKEQRLNIGLAVWSGCFDIRYGNYKPKIAVYPKEQALAAFVMRMLARLQTMGSCSGRGHPLNLTPTRGTLVEGNQECATHR